jgi:hypothetical protein
MKPTDILTAHLQIFRHGRDVIVFVVKQKHVNYKMLINQYSKNDRKNVPIVMFHTSMHSACSASAIVPLLCAYIRCCIADSVNIEKLTKTTSQMKLNCWSHAPFVKVDVSFGP